MTTVTIKITEPIRTRGQVALKVGDKVTAEKAADGKNYRVSTTRGYLVVPGCACEVVTE